ncbi:hypothetical protein R9C00_02185 [Flammeovirgaceae bacterium SG7u.111]|nr:hypothetical protein [Flammeovirgaceae bacterium SG7u.132]WPO36251.1 hypothetical protein R9C00_02185 [Flammeovirgaceae bacterium SG7u.111]
MDQKELNITGEKANKMGINKVILLIAPALLLVMSFYTISQLNSEIATYVSTPKYGNSQTRSYTEQEIKVKDGEYEYKYVFKDHKDNLVTWDWSLRKEFVDEMSESFGVPVSDAQAGGSAQDIVNRKMAIKTGLFYEADGKIEPNYKAIADVHNIVASPLYTLSEEYAKEIGGNRLDQIETLLKFCQDMPYREPPENYNGRLIKGVFPPSISLTKGWGDCDTKAMIFASALKNSEVFKLVVIYLPNHVLIGVRGVPRPYQTAVKFRGESYIVCDPSGIKRLRFGERPENAGPIQMIRAI